MTLTTFHILIRSVEYLALFTSAGGSLFLVMTPPDESSLAARLQPGLLMLAGVAGASAILDVGLHGVRVTHEPLGLVTGSAWVTGLASARGLASSIILVGTGFSALGIVARHTATGRTTAVVGAAMAALGLAAGSDASLDDPLWPSFATVTLHGLASLMLVGAVWPLLVTLTTQTSEICARVFRTGLPPLALALALVLLTGVLLSPSGVVDRDAVTGTPYGLLWLSKAFLSTLFVALLAGRTLRPSLIPQHVTAKRDRMRRQVLLSGLVLSALVTVSAMLEITQDPALYRE